MAKNDSNFIRSTFRDGKLYLGTQGLLQVIRPWGPRAGAWHLPQGHHWTSFSPTFTITCYQRWIRRGDSSPFCRYRANALSSFLDLIPRPALGAVRRYRFGNWPMLQFLNRCGAAGLELARSNPALAFLLAARRWTGGRLAYAGVDAVRQILLRKQREIAAAVGFPAAESSVKILRKVPVSSISLRLLGELREALEEERAHRFMTQVPRLNGRTIRAIADPMLRPVLTPRLLLSLSAKKAWDFSSREVDELREVVQLGTRLGRKLPKLLTFSQVRDLHEELIELSYDTGRDYALSIFPSAPFPDVDNVISISTPQMLIAEGREMRHCVGSYDWLVPEGDLYFYRMHSPRLTILLRQWRDHWFVKEIRGKMNRSPNAQEVRAVAEWLERVQPTIDPDAFGLDRWPPDPEGDSNELLAQE